MTISRRKFLLSLGLLAAGCTSSNQMSQLPPPTWPGETSPPRPTGSGYSGNYASTTSPYSSPYVPLGNPSSRVNGVPHRPMEAGPLTAQTGISGAIHAIPRSRWAEAPPIMSRIYLMNGVNRITIHHEGYTVVTFSDAASTAQRLEQIRLSHVGEQLHAGDIAYHYIIDRAGRVWQGRDVRYQGAHVKYENEHNVGVMVLGNFEVQEPTQAQLATLHLTVRQLMAEYRVPIRRVYTHRELGPTECPGDALQRRVVVMRYHNFA